MNTKSQIEALETLSQQAASWLVGRTTRWLREQSAPRRGSDGRYSGRELVAWFVDHQLAAARKVPETDDPLMVDLSGGGSVNLEKYRYEKARQAQRENDLAEGMLVDADSLRIDLAAAARVLREGLAAIETVHGPEVGDAIRQMIDEAEAAWTQSVRARLDATSTTSD